MSCKEKSSDKNLRYRTLGSCITISLLFLLFISCNKPTTVTSSWPTSAISIDGDGSEWKNVMNQQEDFEASIGVMNDSNYLYLYLTSRDRELNRKIMKLGFTIWFKHQELKDGKIGLHFPIGMKPIRNPQNDDRKSSNDPELQRERNEEALREIEIIGPDKNDSRTFQTIISESYGIQAKIQSSPSILSYELRLPLHNDSTSRFSLHITKDTVLNVSLETFIPDYRRPRTNTPDMGGSILGGSSNSDSPTGRGPGGDAGRGTVMASIEQDKIQLNILLAKPR